MAADLRYAFGKRLVLGGAGGSIDFDSSPVYVMLVNQTYHDIVDATKHTHDFRDDVTANEIAGTGYTAGGLLLTGATIASDGANGYKVTYTNPQWSSATIGAWGAVWFMRVGADLTTPADDPLLWFSAFNALVSSTASTYTLTIPGTGLYILP